MALQVVDHPLVAHRVAELRDVRTGSAEFRRVAGELAGFLAYEATRDLPTVAGTVTTPLDLEATTRTLPERRPLLVPVLRAGLALLDGVLGAVPTAEVGLVGLARNEQTQEPVPYCVRLPADLVGPPALVLDPMLATGGSMAWTCRLLAERGITDITALVLIAAPEGVARVEAECPAGEDLHRRPRSGARRARLHRARARRRRRPPLRSGLNPDDRPPPPARSLASAPGTERTVPPARGGTVLSEFKKFILRGNVLDLAVAVIIGAASAAVITAFTNGILMNLIAAIFGQPSFDSIVIEVGDGELLIGEFITAVVNFLVVAFALFLIIKAFEQMQARRRSGTRPRRTHPAPTDEALILAEIRDLLRAQGRTQRRS